MKVSDFNEMKRLPVYAIRKPWNIILAHAYNQLEFWQYEDKVELGDIEKVDFSYDNLSKYEKHFIESNNIRYSQTYYVIRSNAIYEVCKKIHTYWHERAMHDAENKGTLELLEAYQKAFTKAAPSRSALQDKVNKYLSKINKPITEDDKVTQDLALFVCEVAKKISLDQNDSNQLLQIEVIKKFILSASLEKKVTFSGPKEKIDEFWAPSTINKLPENFYNSQWQCFERTDGIAKQKAAWSIAISYVHIGEIGINDYIPITLSSVKANIGYEHKGIVTFDAPSGCLIAQLFRDDVSNSNLATPAFFIMRISNFKDQKLLMGYFTYFSVFYNRFLTKTVIWKVHHGAYEPQEVINTDKGFSDIDINIARFLNSRSKNRISIPSTNISNLDPNDTVHSLQSWINHRIKYIAYDDILKACVDKYYVCYFYGQPDKAKYKDFTNAIKKNSIEAEENKSEFEEKKTEEKVLKDKYIAEFIRIDELEINFNPYSTEFEAQYQHKLRVPNIEPQLEQSEVYLKGKVRRKRLTIQIVLEETDPLLQNNEFADELSPINNFILLTFCVPEAELKVDQTTFFPGIISGLSDYNNEPISFRAVIVKRRYKKNKKGEVINDTILNLRDKKNRNSLSNQIINYFRRHIHETRIKVAPPSNSSFDKYSNISNLILDGGSVKIEPKIPKNGIDIIYQIICYNPQGDKFEFEDTSIDGALTLADKYFA